MDQVAIDFPDLKMVLAHLGHPWEGETIAVIRRNANVYADVSALYYRPWQFYNSMRLVTEYRADHKVLLVLISRSPRRVVAAGSEKPQRDCRPKRPAAGSGQVIEGIIHRDLADFVGTKASAGESMNIPSSMRALQLQAANQLVEVCLPVPQPRSDEVLVRTAATTICTSDLNDIACNPFGIVLPRVLGHEGAGVIVALRRKRR